MNNSNLNYKIANLSNITIYLLFGDRFNESVDNLPEGIKHITFGADFIKSLDNLPSSLKNLTFYDYSKFNCPVDNLPLI